MRRSWLALAPLAALLLALWAGGVARASHFRYATYNWRRLGDENSLSYEFFTEKAWRCSYYYYSCRSVGDIVDISGYSSRRAWQWNDGSSATKEKLSINVINTENNEDYFIGTQTVQHTFTSRKVHSVTFNGCCRISTLLDGNRDRAYDLAFTVDTRLGMPSRSVRSTSLPVIFFQINTLTSFTMPVSPSDSDQPLEFSLSPSDESGLTRVQPSGFTLTPTGLVSWKPTTKGLYAVQFTISDQVNTVVLDVLLEVAEECTGSRCPNPPRFVPDEPVAQDFFLGTELVFDVVAEDPDGGVPFISSSALPAAAILLPCKEASGSRCTRTFRWTPSLGQEDTFVCFTTSDADGNRRLGQYCVDLVRGVGKIIYASGVVRDFLSSHPDFGLSSGGDTSRQIVGSALGSNGKPTYLGGAATVRDAASFAEWFNTDAATDNSRVFSVTLTNAGQADPRIFQFDTSNLYPIDGDVLGNQGGDHNLFFTYEVHTYITYDPAGGEVYDFRSANDLWVFVDGVLAVDLGGAATSSRAGTLRFDDFAATHSLVPGESYRVDIFFAHRLGGATPALQLQLNEASLCNALSSGTEVAGFEAGFSTSDAPRLEFSGDAPGIDGQSLVLARAGSLTSGAVWLGSGGAARRQKFLNGFRSKFSFRTSGGTPEGLAFVLQSFGPSARGGSGANLGYAGLTNSLAVEVDMAKDPNQFAENGDPKYEHISVQSRFTAANSASQDASLGVTADEGFGFANGSLHTVTIEYTPALDDSTGGPLLGWLRVFYEERVVPVLQVQLDGTVLQGMFPGSAGFVGFTAANSEVRSGTIEITDWTFSVVPPTAQQSAAVVQPLNLQAGREGLSRIQLKDACAGPVRVGGDADQLKVRLERLSDTATGPAPSEDELAVVVTDNDDGTYDLSYSPTTSGNYLLDVRFGADDGQPVGSSPYQFGVTSDVSSAGRCTAVFGPFEEAFDNSGGARGLALAVFEADGSVATALATHDTHTAAGQASFVAAFGSATAGRVVAVAARGSAFASDAPNAAREALFNAGAQHISDLGPGEAWAMVAVVGGATPEEAASGREASVSLQVGGSGDLGFTVFARSAAVDAGNAAYVQLVANLYHGRVNEPQAFTVTSRDQFDNPQTGVADTFDLSFFPSLSDGTGSVDAPTALSDGRQLLGWTTQTSGLYSMLVQLGGEGVQQSPIAVNILAGPAVAAGTVLSGPGLYSAVAGVNASFQVALHDVYGNRVSGAGSDDAVTATLTPGGGGTPVVADGEWDAARNAFTVEYEAVRAGEHALVVRVNGDTFGAHSFAPNVEAGPIAAANCTLEVGSAEVTAGAAAAFTIVARDRYGNEAGRQVPGGGAGLVASVAPAALDGAEASLAYLGGGRYEATFVPTAAGTTAATVSLDGVAFGGAGVSFEVEAGPVHENSEVTGVAGGEAGPQSLTITARDAWGNVRSGAGMNDTDVFDMIARSDGDEFVVEGSVSLAGGGAYTVAWTATRAGSYAVSAGLRGGSALVGGDGSQTAVVTAGPAHGPSCLVDPSAGVGGVEETSVTLAVVSRDQYKNRRDGAADDLFGTVQPAVGAPVGPISAAGQGGGLYHVTYSVPSFSAGAPTFALTVQLNPAGGGGPEPVFQENEAPIGRSGVVSYAEVVGGSIADATAGVEASFQIEDLDNVGDPVTAGSSTFRVFFSGPGAVSVAGVVRDGENLATYTARFTPRVAGSYAVRVLQDGVESNASKAPGYTVTCVAGSVQAEESSVEGFPATIAAGEWGTAVFALADAFGNVIDSPAPVVGFSTTSPITTSTPEYLGGGRHRLNYTATSGGLHALLALVNGGTTVGGLRQLVVVPAAPSAANSWVLPGAAASPALGGDIEAGSATRVTVQLADRFGNPLTGDTADAAQFSVELRDTEGGAVVDAGFARASYASGLYSLQFAPTAAGTLAMTARYAGEQVNVTDFNVTVVPTDPSDAKSEVEGAGGPPTTAGSAVSFVLVLRDAFDNPWAGRGDLVSVDTIGPDGEAVEAALDIVDGSGRYAVTLDAAASTAAGNYTSRVVAGGVPLESLTTVSTVVHGPADAAASVLRIDAASVAGQTAYAEVQLRDRFLNEVLTGSNSVAVEMLVDEPRCDDLDDPDGLGPQVPSSAFETAVEALGAGRHNVSYLSRTTGTFTMSLLVDGDKMPCEQNLAVSVQPGAPSAAHSLADAGSGTGLVSGTAGATLAFTVTVRDAFGNEVGGGSGATVEVARPPSPGEAPDGAVGWIDSATAGVSVAVRDNADGTFGVTYSAERAGLYELAALVSGDRMVLTRPTVVILPGAVASFEATAIGDVEAGRRSEFSLSSKDRFDNAVTSGGHEFSVVFTSVGRDYSFAGAGTFDSESATHTVTFTPAWHGRYDVLVQLANPNPADFGADGPPSTTLSVEVAHATCAFAEPGRPYRCPGASPRRCVASYADCAEVTATGPQCADAGRPVRCHNGSCVAASDECPCPAAGESRCPYSGLCVDDPSARCLVPAPCPVEFPHRCAGSGACRASQAECPALRVCAPGFSVCPDGRSCSGFGIECPAVNGSSPCAAGGARCPDGRCVAAFEDCAVAPTCPAGQPFVCPDGSCQASPDRCPSVFPCPGGTRCFDGTCAGSPDQCPGAAVCPVGQVVCPSSGRCAATPDECGPGAAECPLSRTRCADGSCQENLLHCSSRVTCPASAPVLCSDGECAAAEFECVRPSSCGAGGAGLATCPDGSCVSDTDFCPTPRSCPADAPVLCADGDCQASVSACGSRPRCPEEAPVRCPDGACRGATVDCPSHTSCPADAPVRCLDDKCVAAPDQCRPIEELRCPAGTVRCPGGECAASQLVCPTTVTCAPAYRRCADGTCRTVCPATAKQCEPDEVACPQSGHGLSCAASITECPLGQVCPVARPVRCVDAQCAASVLACPVPEAGNYSTSQVPCSDGSFESDPQQCGTPVTCPAAAPYKCYDDTCRVSPVDCPEPPSCEGGEFLCHDGNCKSRLWQCRAFGSEQCGDGAPVRCVDGQCAASVALCAAPFPTNAEDFSCPHGWFRCRDGSCRDTSSLCENLECPPEMPHLCLSGMCAPDARGCDLPNSCPASLPERCWDGACNVTCTAPERPCEDEQLVRCADGSCAPNANICPDESGCPPGFMRCHDGRCEPQPRDVTSFNPCTSRRADGNTCPGSKPYRCPRGFCAVSSLLCPEPLDDTLCPLDRPVLCDSGRCRLSALQCAVIVPCGGELGEERCADGTCREEGACPEAAGCPANYTRCPNGVCGPADEACYDDRTGCAQDRVLCPDSRACVSALSECDAQDSGSNRLTANGCPAARPDKCFNGECVAGLENCLGGNGCPLASPFLCGDGTCTDDSASCDGSGTDCAAGHVRCGSGLCAAAPGLCGTSGGCPATDPFRCADGECRRLASTALPGGVGGDSCAPTVACSSAEVRCADASCAPSSTLCPSHEPCPLSAPLRCSDGSCAVSQANCLALPSCPSSAPVVCPDGRCRETAASCEAPAGGSAARSCGEGETACFDGTCRASPRLCIKWAYEVRRNETVTDAAFDRVRVDASGAVCPEGEVPCLGGACVAGAFLCGVQDRCPASASVRCEDGQCRESCAGVSLPSCPSGGVRCPDGTCRSACLPFDGCPLSAPHHCADRTCGGSAAACPAAKVAGPWCVDGCPRDVKARLTVAVVELGEGLSQAIGVTSDLVPVGSIDVPSGGVRRAKSGTGGDLTLQIRPVADSQLRGSSVTVPRTRVAEFGESLSYLEAVVSSSFECVAGGDVLQPFPIPMAVAAVADLSQVFNCTEDPDGCDRRDVCFASLAPGESEWQCLQADPNARDAGPEQADGAPYNEFAATLSSCQAGTFYAFVLSPNRIVLPATGGGGGLDWWVWLTIVISSGVFLVFVSYFFLRLYRYRKKLHDKRKEVNELHDVVHDMEMYGAAATRDEDVAMIQNPLALNMKEMSGRTGMQTEDAVAEGAVYADDPEAAARQNKLATLEEDRRRLQQDLDKMKAELETRGNQAGGHVDDMSGQHAGGVSAVGVAGPSAAPLPPPHAAAAAPASREEGFGAARRPKKRNI